MHFLFTAVINVSALVSDVAFFYDDLAAALPQEQHRALITADGNESHFVLLTYVFSG